MRARWCRSTAYVLSCGYLAFTLSAADDVTRFLLVTNWYATFTHSLTEHGSLDYIDPYSGDPNSASWRFDHSMTVSCQLGPDPQGNLDPDFLEFFWKQNDSTAIHFSDSFEQTTYNPDGSVKGHHRVTVNDVAAPPTNFIMNIQPSQGMYSLRWDGADPPFTSDVTFDDTTFAGNIGVFWAPVGGSDGVLPETGMMLEGRESFSMREQYWEIVPATATYFMAGDPFFLGDSPLGPHLFNSDLVLTWSLSPSVEELEVVVEPVGYDDWIPEGNLVEPSAFGNTIKVKAELRKKGGGQPGQKATKFLFELADVSQEKGVCMNWPPEDQADEEFDLRFETDRNTADWISSDIEVIDTLNAETRGDPSYSAEVNVSSFDCGAFGIIKVKALVGGKLVEGYLKTDSAGTLKNIPLPRRAPGDYVGDPWKEKNGVTSQSSADDVDEQPTGDGHVGDGLTLYEEYRGFSVDGIHRRTNPMKKQLFVLSDGSADATSGIGLFAKSSGLEVLQVKPQEFGIRADKSYSRIINHNHGDASRHVVDQHGIWIVTRDNVLGFAQAERVSGTTGNSTPGTKARVVLDPPSSQYSGRSVGRSVVGSSGQITTEFAAGIPYAASTVAHELAHCCSVYHHSDRYGDADPMSLRILEGPHADGTYRVSLDGAEGDWWLRHEDGSVRWEKPGNGYAIGRKGGWYGGDDTCFMRYDNSNGYFSNTSPTTTIYLLFQNNTEPAGSSLCTSAAGRGINAAHPGTHWPRYGDADMANHRGNCFGQICVNDLHANDASHQR